MEDFPKLGRSSPDPMASVATRAPSRPASAPAPMRTERPDRGRRTGRVRDQLRSPWLWLVTFAVWLGVVLLEQILLPHPVDRLAISYTYFKQEVAVGNVVDVNAWADTIQGDFRAPVPGVVAPGETSRKFDKFATNIPSFADHAQLDQLLASHDVTVNVQPLETPRSPLFEFLVAFGPTLLFIVGFLWVSKRMTRGSGGLFGMGRSRARRYDAGDGAATITFADVAGIDEVESELAQIVEFLKQPEKYQRLGGRMPRGVLLVGPPGTGKTLLARAVAGEAGVPFFSMSGSEFVEMVVGVGASRVRDLFAQAKKAAPAIIFVDEIDAIGRRRGSGGYGSNEEREQTLNQLLVEMDGFDAREAVVVVAASNRPDVLDAALLRPGRFDRRVTVLPPDRVGRKEILQVHVRGVPLAPDVDLGAVAAQTPGLVGADLRNLVNEAALLAARRGKDRVGPSEFSDSIEKIALGAERRLAIAPEERRRIAYHEAGHALLGFLQPEADPPRRVTVVPRGQALGVTLSVPEDDRYNYGEDYLRARITCTLGGRAAEQLVYGVATTGAENDLKQVTDLARAMVTRWGMSPEVGLLALGSPADGDFLAAGLGAGPSRAYGDDLARAVDDAIRRIVDECYTRATDLLGRERARLDALSEALLREESLDEERMRAVVGIAAAPATSGRPC